MRTATEVKAMGSYGACTTQHTVAGEVRATDVITNTRTHTHTTNARTHIPSACCTALPTLEFTSVKPDDLPLAVMAMLNELRNKKFPKDYRPLIGQLTVAKTRSSALLALYRVRTLASTAACTEVGTWLEFTRPPLLTSSIGADAPRLRRAQLVALRRQIELEIKDANHAAYIDARALLQVSRDEVTDEDARNRLLDELDVPDDDGAEAHGQATAAPVNVRKAELATSAAKLLL